MTILTVKDLAVTFDTADGAVNAVRGISFDVAAGECLGIVGESGSGKSQSALAAMGLLAENGAATGQILFNGTDMLTAPKPQLRKIRGAEMSMIFQDPLTSLTPHMTVGAQMREILALHKGLKGEAANRRCVDWLEHVRIPEAARRLDQFPHELSGGMRQRVALARSLAPNPRVLLMDEPFSALDALTREQLYGDIQEIFTKRKKTIVLVTHNIREAVCLGDRVVLFSPNPGRVQQVFDVNLPRPRRMNDPALANLAAEVTTALSSHLTADKQ